MVGPTDREIKVVGDLQESEGRLVTYGIVRRNVPDIHPEIQVSRRRRVGSVVTHANNCRECGGPAGTTVIVGVSRIEQAGLKAVVPSVFHHCK